MVWGGRVARAISHGGHPWWQSGEQEDVMRVKGEVEVEEEEDRRRGTGFGLGGRPKTLPERKLGLFRAI